MGTYVINSLLSPLSLIFLYTFYFSGINSSEKQNPSTVVITKMNDNNSPITSQDENYMVENDNSHESTPHIDLPSQDMNGQSENDEGIIIDIYRIVLQIIFHEKVLSK